MTNFILKPYIYAIIATIAITSSSVGVLLDAFVIENVGSSGEVILSSNQSSSIGSSNDSISSSFSSLTPTYTSNSYIDNNISLTIETKRSHNTTVYVADIQISEPMLLKTALAQNTYGRNINQATSSMATLHGAIFAVNGDYYGSRTDGFVVRNGVLYRSTPNTAASGQSLLMSSNGDMTTVTETSVTRNNLIALAPYQAWSFGPTLINNGTIMVNSSSEVNQSSGSNPRTSIGQIHIGHYVIIVTNGRLTNEDGLTLLELAEEFALKGCEVAYNLDGGGSSTMWFNGNIVNKPVNHGSTISERSVSDCVYIGY